VEDNIGMDLRGIGRRVSAVCMRLRIGIGVGPL